MGIIRTAVSAVTGTVKSAINDQFLDVIEPGKMDAETVFVKGEQTHRGANKKGTVDTISDGSVIHVYDNQFMILTDGGKVIDYTAEPGYYTVSNSSLPSMLNGQLDASLRESFARLKFGGATPVTQKVYYVNLQEIKGIKFGTRSAVNYFDSFYNAELFLRAHGTYSIKITDPLKFYAEVVPRNADRLQVGEINEQYLSEFLEALQTAINRMSADGTRISYVTSKAMELGKYMADVLDEDWTKKRGMQIQSVGIASISYDEESKNLINMRNQGAMMGDPNVRQGYVQSTLAQGMQAAASNPNGAMAGFMGMGVGMQAAGSFLGQATQINQQQAQQMAQQQSVQQAAQWRCSCGAINSGNFCSQCGKPSPGASWTCACGAQNVGNFCTACGKPRG